MGKISGYMLLNISAFFKVFAIIYKKKLELYESGNYSVFIRCFICITPNVGELVTQR